MEQIGTINGFPVVKTIENNCVYLACHGEKMPGYHLKNIIKLIDRYEVIFETTEHVLKENIFGMYVSFDEIKKLYS